jgi:transcriptional regulator with XRE-family HTH domain
VAITTAQMRGARGLLNWSQSELSKRTGISTTSIGNIEAGNTQPREATMKLIRQAFENSGIEFIGTEGMRVKNDTVDIFEGQQGFLTFFDNVYQTLMTEEASIYACNIDESIFEKWAGDTAEKHLSRMSSIESLHCKVLLKEGDNNFIASNYAEYRWLPQNLFSSVPFYVYGSKLAIILFGAEPKIIVLNNSAVTEAYKKQFMGLWDIATKPRLKEAC